MDCSGTTSSSIAFLPYSSSLKRVPSPTMAASSNAENGKLWPPPIEKHFINVLVEEEIKGNMPTPNSDEKQELDAGFLTYGVHVTVEADNGDNMEEPSTPVEGQGNRRVGKLPSQTASLARKKRKGGSLGEITDAINNFTEMSRAVEILNSIENVDDFTVFKILKELYNPDSRAAFISSRPDRRRGWADLVGSLM
ncbi:hypothetical protein CFP56_003350 [Quercus suber]|uniref:Uncharacterized protein n=1 Tax=Quercus suber TaxID=58331 RepID=A0AAW0IIW2_QUESU